MRKDTEEILQDIRESVDLRTRLGILPTGKRKKYRKGGKVKSLDEAGEELVFGRVAAGESVGSIATDYHLSRDAFYRWSNKVDSRGSTRWTRLVGPQPMPMPRSLARS